MEPEPLESICVSRRRIRAQALAAKDAAAAAAATANAAAASAVAEAAKATAAAKAAEEAATAADEMLDEIAKRRRHSVPPAD